jgi:hypothetical protein
MLRIDSLAFDARGRGELQQTQRRMSVRAVATAYGIPARVISRAISSGELRAVVTTTETGRERAYIAAADAATWFETLSQPREKARA